MSDPLLVGLWIVILAGGLGVCVGAGKAGLPSTYARDLLHIGAGIWVLGWPFWDGSVLPIALAAAVASGTALVPLLARRSPAAAKLRDTVSGGDESWNGLILYGLSYAGLTAVGLLTTPFAAAAGLLALSLGDGVGGAVGRRFGRLRFRTPGAKHKTLEGAAAVALFAGLGVVLASHLFHHPVPPRTVGSLAVVAALAEALAPRGSDNALVPLTVWGLAEGVA